MGLPTGVAAAFDAQREKFTVVRQRDILQQVIHQTTHSLARFFLEIDANHKQFQTARRLREAAQVRLDQSQKYYKAGQAGFSVDRLLDAIAQYADAVVQEAQYKCSYNTSLAALEEAKGTLLSERSIVLAPKPRGTAAKWAGVASTRVVEGPRTGVFGTDLEIKPATFAPQADATSEPVAPKAARPPRAAGSSVTTSHSKAALCRSSSRAPSRSARPPGDERVDVTVRRVKWTSPADP